MQKAVLGLLMAQTITKGAVDACMIHTFLLLVDTVIMQTGDLNASSYRLRQCCREELNKQEASRLSPAGEEVAETRSDTDLTTADGPVTVQLSTNVLTLLVLLSHTQY